MICLCTLSLPLVVGYFGNGGIRLFMIKPLIGNRGGEEVKRVVLSFCRVQLDPSKVAIVKARMKTNWMDKIEGRLVEI